jgi:predicted nucleic acid-binding protein
VIAYLDSSVILRVALKEREALPEWTRVTRAITSSLAIVECNRALMRVAKLNPNVDPALLREARMVVEDILRRCDVRRVSARVINRAASPFDHFVTSLDAIHLATAIVYRDERSGGAITHFATHDIQLANAARGMHFPTLGA